MEKLHVMLVVLVAFAFARPQFRNNEHIPLYEKTLTVPVGIRAELRCPSSGVSDPINWVRGDNSSLPDNSVVRGDMLYIENVQPSDAGEYRCLGIDLSGTIQFSFKVHLMVASPPRITIQPPNQVVRPGDNVSVECIATGEHPITITWTAINRQMPETASTRDGLLQFHGIQVVDSGRYKCAAINPAGEGDAIIEIIIKAN